MLDEGLVEFEKIDLRKEKLPSTDACTSLPTLDSSARARKVLIELVRDVNTIEKVSEKDWKSSEFLSCLKAAKLPEEVLGAFVGKSKEDLIASLCENPFIYLALPDDFKNSLPFCRLAMKEGADIFTLLPAKLQVDTELLSTLVKRRHFTIDDLGPEILSNREDIKKILEVKPALFADLSIDLRSDREIVCQILARAPGLVKYVPPEVLQDTEIQILVASLSLASESYLEQACPSKVCEEAKSYFAKHREALKLLEIKEESANYVYVNYQGSTQKEPPQRFFNCAEVVRGRYEIASPELRNALEDIYGKDYLVSVDKPNVLFISADTAAKPVSLLLDGKISVLDETSRVNRVAYFEVDSEDRFKVVIHSVKNSKQGGVENLVVLGHGNQYFLVLKGLEGVVSAQEGEQSSIDMTDRDLQRELIGDFKPGFMLVLYSCYTGVGQSLESQIENIAGVVRGFASFSTVYAPRAGITFANLVDPSGVLIPPEYFDGDTPIATLELKPINAMPSEQVTKWFAGTSSEIIERLYLNERGVLIGRREGDPDTTVKLYYFGKTVGEVDLGQMIDPQLVKLGVSMEKEILREEINQFLMTKFPDGGDMVMENMPEAMLKELEANITKRLDKPVALNSLSYNSSGLKFEYGFREFKNERIAEGDNRSTY